MRQHPIALTHAIQVPIRVLALVPKLMTPRIDDVPPVSCNAGYGRTGTVIACVLVTTGMSADQAIAELITKRPGAREILQVPGQAAAIRDFAGRQTT